MRCCVGLPRRFRTKAPSVRRVHLCKASPWRKSINRYYTSLTHPFHSTFITTQTEVIIFVFTLPQQFTAEFDIDLSFMFTNESALPEGEIGQADWRTAMNSFCRHGHNQFVKRQIGLDLATRVTGGIKGPAIANGRDVFNVSEDYKDELLDRVLIQFSPSKLAMGSQGPRPAVRTRSGFFTLEYKWKDVWMSPSELKELEQFKGCEDYVAEGRYCVGETVPMMGRNVLILDSGRGDGVTEALCECFCKLGACVVVTFVCDDRHRDGSKNAERIVEMCNGLPGSVQIIGGVPYRSKLHTKQPAGVRFVEDLLDEAMRLFLEVKVDCVGKCTCRSSKIRAIDLLSITIPYFLCLFVTTSVSLFAEANIDNTQVVSSNEPKTPKETLKKETNKLCLLVNNVGWDYCLNSSQTLSEMMHLIQRDSRRNLLAFEYVISHLHEGEYFSTYENAVVNIAGLGCNIATSRRGNGVDDYDFQWKFMQWWYNWVCSPHDPPLSAFD